jgi:hypothetical protein
MPARSAVSATYVSALVMITSMWKCGETECDEGESAGPGTHRTNQNCTGRAHSCGEGDPLQLLAFDAVLVLEVRMPSAPPIRRVA